jgi:hypothetical protein
MSWRLALIAVSLSALLDTEFRALLQMHNPSNGHCRHAENA